MTDHMMYGLIFVCLCICLSTASQSSGKEAKHNASDDELKANLTPDKTYSDPSSVADKKPVAGGGDNSGGNGVNLSIARKGQDKKRQQGRAERRHQRIAFHGKRACSVKSSYLEETTDLLGDRVLIATSIDDNGNVPQFILETYCMKEHCNCRGVDTLVHESACITKSAPVVARVYKAGKKMWSFVKVRVACSCVVRMKNNHSMYVYEN